MTSVSIDVIVFFDGHFSSLKFYLTCRGQHAKSDIVPKATWLGVLTVTINKFGAQLNGVTSS